MNCYENFRKFLLQLFHRKEKWFFFLKVSIFYYRYMWTADSVLGLSRLDGSCPVTFRKCMEIYWGVVYANILSQPPGSISWSSISPDGMRENHWHGPYVRGKRSGTLVPISLTFWSTGRGELHPEDPHASPPESPLDGLMLTKNPQILIHHLSARILEGHLLRLPHWGLHPFPQPHGGWHVWHLSCYPWEEGVNEKPRTCHFSLIIKSSQALDFSILWFYCWNFAWDRQCQRERSS